MAMGITTAYFALRAGAEEIVLPGQHGLRDWALATPLGLGRILRGYVLGQLVHSLHLLALSSPLLLMAFTVSGGEWAALGWCVAAALVQALFYRLCGAITHLTIGQHRTESYFTVRAILVVVYVPVGWLAPFTSHVAFASRVLGESMTPSRQSRRCRIRWRSWRSMRCSACLRRSCCIACSLRERRGTTGPPRRCRRRRGRHAMSQATDAPSFWIRDGGPGPARDRLRKPVAALTRARRLQVLVDHGFGGLLAGLVLGHGRGAVRLG